MLIYAIYTVILNTSQVMTYFVSHSVGGLAWLMYDTYSPGVVDVLSNRDYKNHNALHPVNSSIDAAILVFYKLSTSFL